MHNPFSLEGKKILITGASSGIGKATAVECSRMGARVIIVGRNEQRLNETFQELAGKEHQYIIADLTRQEDMDRIVADVSELDGLVNNAGIVNTKPVQFIKREDLECVLETNTLSPILLTKSLLKRKKIKKEGSIVFTSSIAATLTEAGSAIYAVSKAALSSYMRSCAVELADKKIRSNAVLPGMIETKLITGGVLSDDDLLNDRKKYPLGRYGKPEEVAYAIIYLLSDASAWVTGTSLVIDGGRLLK